VSVSVPAYFVWYWNGDNYMMNNIIIGFTLNPIQVGYYIKDEMGV
jgi:hypothetical protein